jgi:hypothetical protein
LVRFYIEAIAANNEGTRAFRPSGAEHMTYYYEVVAPVALAGSVSINELLAKNDAGAADEQGQTEDWIEFFYVTESTVDLTGWHLTDNPWNLTKWAFPDGTALQPDGYLIVWADEDGTDGPLHANFKLSSSGETLLLINAAGEIEDQVTFTEQTADQAFARMPNGTGEFNAQGPTFGFNNEHVGIQGVTPLFGALVYPNPSSDEVHVTFSQKSNGLLQLHDASGRLVYDVRLESTHHHRSDVSRFQNGVLHLSLRNDMDVLYTGMVLVHH